MRKIVARKSARGGAVTPRSRIWRSGKQRRCIDAGMHGEVAVVPGSLSSSAKVEDLTGDDLRGEPGVKGHGEFGGDDSE
jgi:hypothetical protein